MHAGSTTALGVDVLAENEIPQKRAFLVEAPTVYSRRRKASKGPQQIDGMLKIAIYIFDLYF